MVRPARTGAADVHPGPLPNRFETLEDLDVRGVVRRGGGVVRLCHCVGKSLGEKRRELRREQKPNYRARDRYRKLTAVTMKCNAQVAPQKPSHQRLTGAAPTGSAGSDHGRSSR